MVPLFGNIVDAADACPKADVFINFASFRSAYASSMEALQIPTIRVVRKFSPYIYMLNLLTSK